MEWLVFSLVASLVLTVLLNVAIRLWPGALGRGTARITEWAERREAREAGGRPGHARIIVPWKAMLLGSVILTVVLNLILRVV